MAKRYPAQKIEIFAVYYKYLFMGSPCRILKVAFPDYADAQKWVKDTIANEHFYKESDFMIEEMNATMKAWEIK